MKSKTFTASANVQKNSSFLLPEIVTEFIHIKNLLEDLQTEMELTPTEAFILEKATNVLAKY